MLLQKDIMETEIQNKNKFSATEPSRCRPLWKRIIYPLVGIILIILGIIGWLIPIIPGVPLIIIGLPLFVCINPRLELWVRRQMHNIGQAVIKRFQKKGSGPEAD